MTSFSMIGYFTTLKAPTELLSLRDAVITNYFMCATHGIFLCVSILAAAIILKALYFHTVVTLSAMSHVVQLKKTVQLT